MGLEADISVAISILTIQILVSRYHSSLKKPNFFFEKRLILEPWQGNYKVNLEHLLQESK